MIGQTIDMDLDALTAALLRLVNNAHLREEMGQKAREHVLTHYTWPEVVRQHEELWMELGNQAGTLCRQRVRSMGYLIPHYSKWFSNYASHLLDEDCPVALTEEGRETLAGKRRLSIAEGIETLLNPEVMHHALATLKAGCILTRKAAIGDLACVMTKKFSIGHNEALMHLMWLLKQGFIRRA